MRMMGFKTIALALGLAIAGVGHAAPATVSTTAAAAAPAAAAAAKPTDPVLAMDGAPAMTATEKLGQPTDGLIKIQPQVTPNGRRAHWFHDVILLPVIVIISLFVLGLLLWVMFRYRAARQSGAVQDLAQHRDRDHLDARSRSSSWC